MPLGKGLESLIPNKGGQAQKNDAVASEQAPKSDFVASGQAQQQSAAPAAPAIVPERELPAVSAVELPPGLVLDPESELDAAPEEELLPVSEPVSLPAASRPAVQPVYAASASQTTAKKARERDGEAIYYIEVAKIVPNRSQPRRNFDQEAIQDLASSIREFGILQPIVVTKHDIEVASGTEVEYELIAGERRLLASKLLGLERIPAIIRHVDLERERLELAVIENLQRENLNPVEMARAFSRLQDEFRLTQREIAARLGKSRETVANTLRLLDLPTYIQEAIEKGEISESHGRLLLSVEDPAALQALFQDLLTKGLTTRELRVRTRVASKKSAGAPEATNAPSSETKLFEQQLASELGAPVTIEGKGPGGKITIDFYSEEELRSIIGRIVKEEG